MTLAKAELHMHLEAGATYDYIVRKAQKYNKKLPLDVFGVNGDFKWQGLEHFVKLYDVFADVIRSEEDYSDLTREYLTSIAKEGAIYSELIVSPDHGKHQGLSYTALLEAIADGVQKAKQETGIETRLQVTCVRHYGIEACEEVAKLAAKNPHPLVTGFGVAGAEMIQEHRDLANTFKIAHEEAGLKCMAHAGEACGADSVRQVLEFFPLSRIGHGVRAIEDPAVLEMLKERDITLEVCPSSNVYLGVAPTWAEHPLRKLVDAGIKTCLNTDDPLYFNTTLGKEYANAQKYLGFTDQMLLQQTRNAIEAAFCDEATRNTLLKKLDGTKNAPKPKGITPKF